MTNSIRTPRLGTNATSRRIAQAVDNEEWQKFRVSMKGHTTQTKLDMLCWYVNEEGEHNHDGDHFDTAACDVCIRVDNYIKALCRGGQLWPNETLQTLHMVDFRPRIKR